MENGADKLRIFSNLAFHGIIIILSGLCTIPLFLIMYYIIKMGISSITIDFLINLPKPVGELNGGVLNAIVGSFMVVIAATLMAIPIGITSGICLSEYKDSKLSYMGRLCTEILQGTPSIVIGIIAYTWIVKPTGQFSALSGSIALGIMMLPLIIRTTEETLNLIPYDIKEASLALGVPYYKTILKVVLPSALSGLTTGVILSIGRVIGETAPLLFTAFGNPYLQFNMLKPVNTLPVLIFNYASSPYEDWHKQAWGASFVLLVWIVTINIFSKILAAKWKVRF